LLYNQNNRYIFVYEDNKENISLVLTKVQSSCVNSNKYCISFKLLSFKVPSLTAKEDNQWWLLKRKQIFQKYNTFYCKRSIMKWTINVCNCKYNKGKDYQYADYANKCFNSEKN